MAPFRRSDADPPEPESFQADAAERPAEAAPAATEAPQPLAPLAPGPETGAPEVDLAQATSLGATSLGAGPEVDLPGAGSSEAGSPEPAAAEATLVATPDAAEDEALSVRRRVEALTRRLASATAPASPEVVAGPRESGGDWPQAAGPGLSDRRPEDQPEAASEEIDEAELSRLRPLDDELLEYFVGLFVLRHRWADGNLVVQYELEASQVTAEIVVAVLQRPQYVELQILGIYGVELSPAHVLPLLNDRNVKYRLSRSYSDELGQLRVELISIHAPQAQMTVQLFMNLFDSVLYELDELLCEIGRDRSLPAPRSALQA